MCGISGICKANGDNVTRFEIELINNKLIHRGPDNGSLYIDKNFAMGHRRLSIIDLSDAAQRSGCGTAFG